MDESSLDAPRWKARMVEMSRSRSAVKSCTVFRSVPKVMMETMSLAVIWVPRNRIAESTERICSGGSIEEKSKSMTINR